MARQSKELRASLQKLRRGMIHDLPAMLKNELIGNVEESAEQLVGLIKSVAPVDPDVKAGKPPGTLRDSIKYTLNHGGLRAYVFSDKTEARYGTWVEWGAPKKGHSEPHPFFYPAYRLLRTSIRRRLAKGVTKAIKFWNANGRAAR